MKNEKKHQLGKDKIFELNSEENSRLRVLIDQVTELSERFLIVEPEQIAMILRISNKEARKIIHLTKTNKKN